MSLFDAPQEVLDARPQGAKDFDFLQGRWLIHHKKDNGTPVLVEFRWDKTNPEAPTWQQSFSADNGNSWEVNWYMSFSRVAT